MDLLLFACAFVLIPAVLVAALAAAVTSWFGITGVSRLICISLAVAMAVSPVFVAAGHGSLPLPFIVALLDLLSSSDPARPVFGHAPDGVAIYLVGVLTLTPLIALALHWFFRAWAHRRSRRK